MPEFSSQNFNHLKIHTQYSICEGAAKIDDLQEFSKTNKLKSGDSAKIPKKNNNLEVIEKQGNQEKRQGWWTQ